MTGHDIDLRILGTRHPKLYARILRATLGKRGFYMWAYGGKSPVTHGFKKN